MKYSSVFHNKNSVYKKKKVKTRRHNTQQTTIAQVSISHKNSERKVKRKEAVRGKETQRLMHHSLQPLFQLVSRHSIHSSHIHMHAHTRCHLGRCEHLYDRKAEEPRSITEVNRNNAEGGLRPFLFSDRFFSIRKFCLNCRKSIRSPESEIL